MASPVRRGSAPHRAAVFAISIMLGAAARPASAQEPAAAKDASSRPTPDPEAVRRRFAEARRNAQVPAAQAAVLVAGRLAFSAADGMLDAENEVLATRETRFRTASIAKPMTAVAALKLAEEGRLDLDADVRRYVPAFREHAPSPTLRQLLGHLGGVRHYARPGEAIGMKSFPTVAATLRLFGDDPLVAPPGEKYVYTTFGYTLIGLAIEQASALAFEDALAAFVWTPARMERTCVDAADEIVPGRARGYRKLDAAAHAKLPPHRRARFTPGAIVPAPFHDTSMKIPGGGLLSTAEDLVRFADALLQDRLLARATRDAAWTAQRTKGGEATGYGLGFGVKKDRAGRLVIAHSGGQAGATCLLRIYPQSGVAAAVMTNLEDAPIDALLDAAVGAYLAE
jgi:CubicO group peptidase (beta-lactamase class C family)